MINQRNSESTFIERRKHVCLTDEQMALLVETVSAEVCARVQGSLKDMMYKELGKSIADQAPGIIGAIAEKLFWFLGFVGTGIFLYLNAHGLVSGK